MVSFVVVPSGKVGPSRGPVSDSQSSLFLFPWPLQAGKGLSLDSPWRPWGCEEQARVPFGHWACSMAWFYKPHLEVCKYAKFQPVEVSKESKLISQASVSLDATEKAVLHITCLLQLLPTRLNWCVSTEALGSCSLTTGLIAGILPHRPMWVTPGCASLVCGWWLERISSVFWDPCTV